MAHHPFGSNDKHKDTQENGPIKVSLFGRLLVAAQFFGVGLVFWPYGPVVINGTVVINGAGVVLFVCGGVLGVWTLMANHIGKFNIVPEVKQGATLVTTGPYAFIRHPMYSALLLIVCGVTAITGTLLNLLGLCMVVAALWQKSRLEEAFLRVVFEKYPEYTRKTKRFIPWVF